MSATLHKSEENEREKNKAQEHAVLRHIGQRASGKKLSMLALNLEVIEAIPPGKPLPCGERSVDLDLDGDCGGSIHQPHNKKRDNQVDEHVSLVQHSSVDAGS